MDLPVWHKSSKSTKFSSSHYRNLRNLVILVASISTILILFFSSTILSGIDDKTTAFCRSRELTIIHDVKDDPTYKSLSPSHDSDWDKLFTKNHGYLYRQYRPEGAENDTVRVYGISMFHQLHCLQMIRFQLQMVAMTDAEPGAELNSMTHEHPVEDKHYLHCLDYLRQAILCNADDHIETPIRDLHKPDHDIVDGQGERKCRDNSKLYEWSRMSGPNLELRRSLAAKGETWPELIGLDWPPPRS